MRYENILGLGVLSLLCACAIYPTSTPIAGSKAGRASSGDIVVEIWVSELCPYAGDREIVRGTVTNIGSQTHIIDLQDQIVFDLIIADSTGQHHWSDGKPLTPDLTRLELNPQESKTIEMEWMVPVGSSGFLATAQLTEYPQNPSGPVKASARVYASLCPNGY